MATRSRRRNARASKPAEPTPPPPLIGADGRLAWAGSPLQVVSDGERLAPVQAAELYSHRVPVNYGAAFIALCGLLVAVSSRWGMPVLAAVAVVVLLTPNLRARRPLTSHAVAMLVSCVAAGGLDLIVKPTHSAHGGHVLAVLLLGSVQVIALACSGDVLRRLARLQSHTVAQLAMWALGEAAYGLAAGFAVFFVALAMAVGAQIA